MRRRLIALIVGMTVGLGAAVPAMASTTLAGSGDATSITSTSADLNGVVYRERVGARWLFEYSVSAGFDTIVASTTPVSLRGRLTAVERKVTGLAPDTTYYWRVVVVVRAGTKTARTFGATRTLTTATVASTTSTSATTTTAAATTTPSATTATPAPTPPTPNG